VNGGKGSSPDLAYVTTDTQHATRSKERWLLYTGLALVVLGALLGSLYWINRNVVLVGRDSAGHLEQSIFVARALEGPWPQALFNAITLDDYRPPALYLLTQPFYWLFGREMDVAQLPNILLQAAILLLTFALARRTLSSGFALFAVLLLALFPMATAMSRFYYMENLLTAALALALLAMLKSDGFARRGWALAWGASLGVALLIKWTSPIYLLVPVVYLLWRSGFWPAQVAALRSFRLDVRLALLALAGGAALALLWYWPSRELVFKQEMPLGDWLPLLWTILWGATIYAMVNSQQSIVNRQPAARQANPPRSFGPPTAIPQSPNHPITQSPSPSVPNFWAAILLALAIASLWYLPRIDFLNRLSDVAFGTDRGTQEAWNLLRLANYTRYFGYWLSHHMGPLATLLIVPVALFGWLRRWRNWRSAGLEITIFWLMVVSSYLFLMLLAQANPRNLVPLLPVTAILLAGSLRFYARPLAIAFGAIWVVVLTVQWAIYTFDELAGVYDRAPQLWVSGDYLQWPATGSTDPGYWIHPEVLAAIGSEEGEPDSLGVLVDTWEIHRGAFRYLTTRDGGNITIMSLTEDDSRGWSDLLANRWILIKDGDNGEVKATGRALIEAIEQGDALFHQLYAPVREFKIPNGDTVTLYQRSDGPRQPQAYPVILIETQPVAETLDQWWSPGATLVFGDRDVAVWLGLHDLAAGRVLLPEVGGSSYPEPLEQLTGTIFVISRYEQAARDQAAQGSYFARDFVSGDTSLAVFGRPGQALETLPAADPWAEVTIPSLASLSSITPGAVLPVEMGGTSHVEIPLKLSMRLVDGAGQVVAQNDVNVEAEMRLGLFVPPGTPPGDYTLGAVLYDPATLAPVLDREGNEFGVLATIEVAP
jgi:4-amino-4-deoxy-L-arabinose transferase-like glycosyltransferase